MHNEISAVIVPVDIMTACSFQSIATKENHSYKHIAPFLDPNADHLQYLKRFSSGLCYTHLTCQKQCSSQGFSKCIMTASPVWSGQCFSDVRVNKVERCQSEGEMMWHNRWRERDGAVHELSIFQKCESVKMLSCWRNSHNECQFKLRKVLDEETFLP